MITITEKEWRNLGFRSASEVAESFSRHDERIEWPDPTPEMIRTPEFEAVWQCIKRWDVNVPGVYAGYCGANGNHVRAILDALKKARIIQ